MTGLRIACVLVAGCAWCVAAAACGDDDGAPGSDAAGMDGSVPGPDGSAPGPDGSVPGPDGGGPGPDGGGPGPDAGGTGYDYCYQSCSTAADCASGSVLTDADNYLCTGNTCQWTGCNDTSECVQAFMDSSYVCGTLPPLSYPNCYKSCGTAADCNLGSVLYDANNYHCTNGMCEWTGCNDSNECAEAFLDASYVCGTLPGVPYATCVKSCATPADCVLANTLYDADNYACAGGLCQWTGCNNTAECVDAMSSNDYVCQ